MRRPIGFGRLHCSRCPESLFIGLIVENRRLHSLNPPRGAGGCSWCNGDFSPTCGIFRKVVVGHEAGRTGQLTLLSMRCRTSWLTVLLQAPGPAPNSNGFSEFGCTGSSDIGTGCVGSTEYVSNYISRCGDSQEHCSQPGARRPGGCCVCRSLRLPACSQQGARPH